MKSRRLLPVSIAAVILGASILVLAQNPVARPAGTLVVASGKTATVSNTLTFTGTDSSSVVFGAGGTVSYTATARRMICSLTTATGTTNSASETNLAVCTIPANTITANGRLEVTVWPKFTGVNNTKIYAVRFSGTSGDVSTGLLFFQVTASATALAGALQRSLWNTGATNSQMSLPLGLIGDGNASSSSAYLTGSIDTTATSYINFNGSTTNSSDTLGYAAYSVTFVPAI